MARMRPRLAVRVGSLRRDEKIPHGRKVARDELSQGDSVNSTNCARFFLGSDFWGEYKRVLAHKMDDFHSKIREARSEITLPNGCRRLFTFSPLSISTSLLCRSRTRVKQRREVANDACLHLGNTGALRYLCVHGRSRPALPNWVVYLHLHRAGCGRHMWGSTVSRWRASWIGGSDGLCASV